MHAALKELSHAPMDEVDALNKKGVACVGLSELDKVIKCFQKIKEIKNKAIDANAASKTL